MGRPYELSRKGCANIMPTETPKFQLSIAMVNGGSFKLFFDTEQNANTKLAQLKGNSWVDLENGTSINPAHIVSIRKSDLTPQSE